MLVSSKNQQYLRAKQIKDQLAALAYLWRSLPQRIEAYDISNLSGTNPTGAMVVAIDGKIDKSQYRLFNIRGLVTPNDPAMMAEMVKRRFNHPEWGRPDLIILDGGKPQIQAVKKVISGLPGKCRVIGLAKNPDRLIGTDKKLDLNTAADRLLIQLRDEAHRFGRKQHLRLRSKTLFA